MARYEQGILVSCELPWDEHEQLIEELFRQEVRFLRGCGFTNLYVFGTAGEGYALDTTRYQQVVRIFSEETRNTDIRPMVGIIGLSTAIIVERIGLAHSAGFRTFQISLPSWGALNDTEMLTFFEDVCGAFPDSQFLHYNLPRAKRLLSGADYRRVIDAVPNLVATKNTGGGLSRAGDLMRNAPELQHFFGEENFAYGCLYGECSLLSSFGAMVPRKTRELFEAGRTRDVEKLFQLQHEFHNLVSDVFGPVLAQERIDGAYDKMIVRMGGLDAMPLRLLSPYQCFSEAEFQQCKRVFEDRYAAWSAQ
jgi:dihydrodipicolinate synthase/N-acetylneuraminate lyase